MKKTAVMLLMTGILTLSLAIGANASEQETEDGYSYEIESLLESKQDINGIQSGNSLEASGYDTAVLTEDGVEVKVADRYGVVLDSDGFYYVYAGNEGTLPYVMFGAYSYTDGEFFSEAFTPMMKKSYSDLSITEAEETVAVGNFEMQRIVYGYTVSGKQIRDTRLAVQIGDNVVMFGSKEIPDLNQTVGNLLYEVAGGLRDGSLLITGGSGKDALPDMGPQPTPLPNGRSQSTEPVIVPEDYFTFAEDMANYEGVWIDTEEGFRLYLPTGWAIYSVNEKMKDAGVIHMWGNNNGQTDHSDIDIRVGVYGVNLGEEENLLTYRDDLIADEQEDVIFYNFNGIDSVSFQSAAGGYCGLAFISPVDPQKIIEVVGFPFGNVPQEITNEISAVLSSVTLLS